MQKLMSTDNENTHSLATTHLNLNREKSEMNIQSQNGASTLSHFQFKTRPKLKKKSSTRKNSRKRGEVNKSTLDHSKQNLDSSRVYLAA